jgi:iron-sulfur cluster assembly protein
MPINLSETAAKEIKKIIVDQELPAEQTRLRVGVKGGGCSGFSYVLDLTEEPKGDNDEEMESHGVKILIDSRSYLYLNGARSTSATRSWAAGSSSRTRMRPAPAAAVRRSLPEFGTADARRLTQIEKRFGSICVHPRSSAVEKLSSRCPTAETEIETLANREYKWV